MSKNLANRLLAILAKAAHRDHPGRWACTERDGVILVGAAALRQHSRVAHLGEGDRGFVRSERVTCAGCPGSEFDHSTSAILEHLEAAHPGARLRDGMLTYV